MGLLKTLQQLPAMLQQPLKRPRWLRPTSPVGIVTLFSLAVGAVVLLVYLPQWQTAHLAEGVDKYQAVLPSPTKEERETLKELAALVLDKQVIGRLLRRELMQESVIYQELQAEAQAAARREAQQSERSLVLRQLQRRVGTVPTALHDQVKALALSDLEDLGEALLDFTALADLEAWLQSH